jgi:hypothetical protein
VERGRRHEISGSNRGRERHYPLLLSE